VWSGGQIRRGVIVTGTPGDEDGQQDATRRSGSEMERHAGSIRRRDRSGIRAFHGSQY
jgi:hypothetical protein